MVLTVHWHLPRSPSRKVHFRLIELNNPGSVNWKKTHRFVPFTGLLGHWVGRSDWIFRWSLFYSRTTLKSQNVKQELCWKYCKLPIDVIYSIGWRLPGDESFTAARSKAANGQYPTFFLNPTRKVNFLVF